VPLLYPQRVRLPIDDEEPRALCAACDRCKRSIGACAPCMAVDGSPGGVLLVSDYPGSVEDRAGRPMVSESGRMLRTLVKQNWSGPTAYTNALRCAAPGGTITKRQVATCRGYLAQDIHEAQPQRILALGSHAIYAVTGHGLAPFSVRGGYAWTAAGVPVFLLMNPTTAMRNRFVMEWFRREVSFALRCKLDVLRYNSDAHKEKFTIVDSVDVARRARALAVASGVTSFDCETSGRFFEDGSLETEPAFRVLCVALWPGDCGETFVWDDEALVDEECLAELRGILADPTIKKIGQNAKYDEHALSHYGIKVRGSCHDTRLVRKILDPEATADLATMQFLVGLGGGKDEIKDAMAAVQKRARLAIKAAAKASTEAPLAVRLLSGLDAPLERYAMQAVNPTLLARYCARDAFTTGRLAKMQEVQLEDEPEHLRDVIAESVPLYRAVADMERWGIAVDRQAVEAFQSILMLEQQQAEAALTTAAASHGMTDFNPASTKQVSDLLFNRLRLPVRGTTAKGAASTNQASLELISKKHPLVAQLLRWREVTKLRGTYADPLPSYIRSDGRVHASFLLDGSRTGRMSCKEPNLANVPRAETPLGKMARDCYVASPGCVLVQFDMSQIELRVAAIESGDAEMRAIFVSGEDYHLRTAEMISKRVWNIEPSDVTKRERTIAKTVNFASLYGIGSRALAHQLGVTIDESEKVMRAILGKFPRLAKYRDEQLSFARRHGYVNICWNGKPFRRRPMWRVADADDATRGVAERGTLNTPVQGMAAEYCLRSLVECVRWIKADAVPAKLVLTVYDSLMFDVREDALNEVLATVPEIMTNWPTGDPPVPLVVDAEVGPSWGSLEKVET